MIEQTKQYIKDYYSNNTNGHDYYHSLRVTHLARQIAIQEGANLEIVTIAALLHDVDDHKISPDTSKNKDHARKFLLGQHYPYIEEVISIIQKISYSDGMIPDSLEGKCVQDADRLDAIGAIGIARTFAYGGSHHSPLYDPEKLYDSSSTIDHFYDKLLKLKDLMNTATGKQLASQRHQYMIEFLTEFYNEVNKKD